MEAFLARFCNFVKHCNVIENGTELPERAPQTTVRTFT
jgi:hypothetical protein